MKKAVFMFIVLATVFLVVLGNTAQAQTAVTKWGFLGGGARQGNWSFTPGTAPGSASIGGSASLSVEWGAIRGGFDSPITATTANAIVVTGNIEFVGAGIDTWSGLRYGLFQHDSAGTVIVDSATATLPDSTRWSGSELYAHGYMFSPISGTNRVTDGVSGGLGTEWIRMSGSYFSTSNGSGPIVTAGVNNQKPARAVADAGVYEFAISVQPLANGTKEVRFYLIKGSAAQSTKSTYYFGGSFIDTTTLVPTFNGICFAAHATGSGPNPNLRGVKLSNVKVSTGTPFTLPEAPWSSYYVDQWGFLGGRQGNWHFVPGAFTGNAGIAGSQTASVEWEAIRGGFVDPVTATTAKAVIVTGKIQFVGAGIDTWSGLRYGLFQHDSAGTVILDSATATLPDSTRWSGSESFSHGYMLSPISGTNLATDGVSGGLGTEWIRVSGNYISTSNGSGPIYLGGLSRQKPARAVADTGVYEFAISVQPLANGTKEVRFYLIKGSAAQSTKSTYFFGDTFIDTTSIAPTFNGVVFTAHAGGSGPNPNLRGVYLTDVKVDLGNPITIPAAPWSAYYIDQWGFIGGRMYGWSFIPDPSLIIGNAGIGGTAPNGKWAAIRGGFADAVTPTTTKALVVTGNVEFVGGGYTAPGTLRFGTFYSDQAGKVILDSSKATLPDSTRWDGNEFYTNGYLFVPPSGANGLMSWAGLSQTASSGAVINGAWLHNDYPASGSPTMNYTLGSDVQTPANAAITAGVYDFAISVYAKSTTSNDVRWKLSKGTSYSITGKLIDTHAPLAATKFNSINFAVANSPITGLKLTNVKVDYVDIASVPITAAPGGTKEVEEAGGTIPAQFDLQQNYPNPFNPSTTIRYDVAKPAFVTIRIYDVLGRMVAQLVDGIQTPASYSVQWSPAGLSSGTYLCRIDALNQDGSGKFSSVKKMLLMK